VVALGDKGGLGFADNFVKRSRKAERGIGFALEGRDRGGQRLNRAKLQGGERNG